MVGSRLRDARPADALLTSVAVSALGDGFRYAALPLLVTLQGGAPTTLGALLAVGTLPFLLVGVVGGALVDRYDRARVLRVAHLCRFAAGATLGLALTLAAPSGTVIGLAFAVAFVMGAFEAVALPATFALTPAVVPAESLTRFNSRVSACETVGRELVGPLLGAATVAAFAPGPFLADACTFLVAYVVLSPVRGRSAPHPGATTGRLGAEIADGFRWLRNQPALVGLAVCAAVVNAANMGFLATEAVYVVHALDAPAVGYGVLMAAAALGGVGMAVALERLASEPSFRVIEAACVLIAAGMVVLAVAPGLAVAAAGAGCAGAGYALFSITSVTLRQRMTPDAWRGRSDALLRSVSWGVLPLGSAVGGIVAATAGLRAPAALTAMAAVAAAGLAAVSARRRVVSGDGAAGRRPPRAPGR